MSRPSKTSLQMKCCLLTIFCLMNSFSHTALTLQEDLITYLTESLDAAVKGGGHNRFSILVRHGIEQPIEPRSLKRDNLSPRGNDKTLFQFRNDLEDVSIDRRRDNIDVHVAHVRIPKVDQSVFDLQIAKDTICDATKFSLGVVPRLDPNKAWKPVTKKTYGEIAGAMRGASEQDIARASKVLVDTVLLLAKPMFEYISGDSSCKAVFPVPKQRREPTHFTLKSVKRVTVDALIDATRSYILSRIESGTLLYLGGALAVWYNVVQTHYAGGFAFVGDDVQANPVATAARARVHSWARAICLYVILEQFQKTMGWETVSQVVSTKLIHPLVNALFDILQEYWDAIKPRQEKRGEKKQHKMRDDPSTCININDFKFVVQNIGPISRKDIENAKAKKTQRCPVPKFPGLS